jgi:hypothetical protein
VLQQQPIEPVHAPVVSAPASTAVEPAVTADTTGASQSQQLTLLEKDIIKGYTFDPIFARTHHCNL